MSEQHTNRSFDEALTQILARFADLGDLVTAHCDAAVSALLTADTSRARDIVAQDRAIDAAFEEIRALTVDALLRFQPVARDMRLVIAIDHSAGDLERAGDHAKSIAKQVIEGHAVAFDEAGQRDLAELGSHVVIALRDAVIAMTRSDAHLAQDVIAADAAIDAKDQAIRSDAMAGLRAALPDPQALVARIIVSKALERIGDHATNIADEVLYLTKGKTPAATRTDTAQG